MIYITTQPIGDIITSYTVSNNGIITIPINTEISSKINKNDMKIFSIFVPIKGYVEMEVLKCGGNTKIFTSFSLKNI